MAAAAGVDHPAATVDRTDTAFRALDRDVDRIDHPLTATADLRGAHHCQLPGTRGLHNAARAAAAERRDLAVDAGILCNKADPPAIDAIGGDRRSWIGAHRLRRRQEDPAAIALHAAGIDHAAVGHQAARQADAAGFRQDLPEVGDIPGGARDLDPHARRSGIGQLDALAGGENDLAARRRDHAAVLNAGSNQVDVAALRRRDAAVVANVTSLGRRTEIQSAGQEIGVTHRQCAGDETGDIDSRSRPHHDAGRIDEPYLAVCRKGPQQCRRIVAHDPVQRCGARARLHEIDAGGGADIEAVPVQDRPVRALRDRQAVAALADAGLPGCHHGAARQRIRRQPCGQCRHAQQQEGSRRQRLQRAHQHAAQQMGDPGARTPGEQHHSSAYLHPQRKCLCLHRPRIAARARGLNGWERLGGRGVRGGSRRDDFAHESLSKNRCSCPDALSSDRVRLRLKAQ